MTDKPTTSSAAEFALQALVAAGHVSQELVDRALALPGAPQPAHSGEPVYAFRRKGLDDFCTCTEKRYAELSDKPTLFETRIFYTAPQTVEREPLTDEAVDLLCKVGPVYAPDGKVTRTPAQYRDELEAAQRYGLRKGERAHGIKGGQHGTDR